MALLPGHRDSEPLDEPFILTPTATAFLPGRIGTAASSYINVVTPVVRHSAARRAATLAGLRWREGRDGWPRRERFEPPRVSCTV